VKGFKSRLTFALRLLTAALIWGYLLLISGSAYIGASSLTQPAHSSICCITPLDMGLAYEPVSFKNADGQALQGWYIPSQNDAVVILLHGYGANRMSMLAHAKMLAENGYGVLLYDQRASGESEGKVRSWGWADIQDVSAALEFVQVQAEDQANRVGILGCSIGGQIAIQSAANEPALRAVVADAPTYSSTVDILPPIRTQDWITWPVYPLLFQFIEWRSGVSKPIPLLQALEEISPRPLLIISTGKSDEMRHAQRYFERAGEPKTWWNIPEASHCTGQVARPDEYEQAIINFFNQAFSIEK
jgi:uncharacterized protein